MPNNVVDGVLHYSVSINDNATNHTTGHQELVEICQRVELIYVGKGIGKFVRLGFAAPRDIVINREEIHNNIINGVPKRDKTA